ncbi:MAG: hypothetical protein ACOCYG_01620 [Spirochaetota bacterium]
MLRMASDSSESRPLSQALTLTPYVFRKLRIDKSQTRLLIENHQLVCTPYRLSRGDALVFAVLTPSEIAFFRRFAQRPCILGIAFVSPNAGHGPQLQAYGVLSQVGAVKGRDNVALFAVRFTQVPEALPRLLENFNLLLKRLSTRYGELSPRRIPMESLRIQQVLGYRKYAELRVHQKSYPVTPRILAVDRAEVRVNTGHVDFAANHEGTLRVDFISGVARVPIRITQVTTSESRATTHVEMHVAFDPLYVEVLDRFFGMVEKAQGEAEPAGDDGGDAAAKAALAQAGDATASSLDPERGEPEDQGEPEGAEEASELTEEA